MRLIESWLKTGRCFAKYNNHNLKEGTKLGVLGVWVAQVS